MSSSLLDPAPEVRQAAAYGVGVAAQFGGEPYAVFCSDSLQNLFKLIVETTVRDDTTQYARENAVSAIGKICHFIGPSGRIDTSRIIVEWVNYLPILKDVEEAEHTYDYLMELIHSRHDALFASTNKEEMTIKLASILVEALATPDFLEGISENKSVSLTRKMADCIKTLLCGIEERHRNALWSELATEKREHLASRGYFTI